jgi:iron complex transport system substrate-binding protein
VGAGTVRQRARLAVLSVGLLSVALLGTACGGEAGGGSAAAAGADGPSCGGARTAASDGWVEPLEPSPEPQLPVTVTDFTGEQITVDDASRILALDTYGTLATTVHALGMGDRLVGRDVSTGVPALADLPVVTHNGHELNAEAILDLDPSLVLTDYSIGPLEVQLQLKEAGIPVVIMDGARRRDVIAEQIRAVAEVLGVAEQGERLAERTEQEVVEAEAAIAELAPSTEEAKARMVFLYLRGTSGVYYWFGEGSGADDLIEALGGVDVASEVGLEGSRPINAEGLVKSEPELYLMMTHGLDSVGGVEGLLEVPGVADTEAGLAGCVVDMADSEILSFGPQFPHTLRALGEAIYGPEGVLGDGDDAAA